MVPLLLLVPAMRPFDSGTFFLNQGVVEALFVATKSSAVALPPCSHLTLTLGDKRPNRFRRNREIQAILKAMSTVAQHT